MYQWTYRYLDLVRLWWSRWTRSWETSEWNSRGFEARIHGCYCQWCSFKSNVRFFCTNIEYGRYGSEYSSGIFWWLIMIDRHSFVGKTYARLLIAPPECRYYTKLHPTERWSCIRSVQWRIMVSRKDSEVIAWQEGSGSNIHWLWKPRHGWVQWYPPVGS